MEFLNMTWSMSNTASDLKANQELLDQIAQVSLNHINVKLVSCLDISISLAELELFQDRELLHTKQLIRPLKLALAKAQLLELEVTHSMELISLMYYLNLWMIHKPKVNS